MATCNIAGCRLCSRSLVGLGEIPLVRYKLVASSSDVVFKGPLVENITFTPAKCTCSDTITCAACEGIRDQRALFVDLPVDGILKGTARVVRRAGADGNDRLCLEEVRKNPCPRHYTGDAELQCTCGEGK